MSALRAMYCIATIIYFTDIFTIYEQKLLRLKFDDLCNPNYIVGYSLFKGDVNENYSCSFI
tara:strand:- start:2139 stop:2321 length:183 start_codon:yes stop_codon:yes gene_type:complete